MTDEKVGFDVARLAKEKGFDVPTLYCFLLDRSEQFSSGEEGDCALYNHNLWDYYSRPTQSLLARWLREVHKIHISPMFIGPDTNKYQYRIDIEGSGNTGKYSKWFLSFEECFEEGLKEGLSLIK